MAALPNLRGMIEAFYNNKELSDVTITFSGRELYCHKFVLGMHSKYFQKLCGPDASFAEAKKPTIDLKEDDPDAVEAMIRFCYLGRRGYIPEIDDRRRDWQLAYNILQTAKKYLMPHLEQQATSLMDRLFMELEISTEDDIHEAVATIHEHYSYDDVLLKRAKDLLELRIENLEDYSAVMKEARFITQTCPDESDLLKLTASRLIVLMEGVTTTSEAFCVIDFVGELFSDSKDLLVVAKGRLQVLVANLAQTNDLYEIIKQIREVLPDNGALLKSATIRLQELASELTRASEIYQAIKQFREFFPDDPEQLNFADSLQTKHIIKLMLLPEFAQTASRDVLLTYIGKFSATEYGVWKCVDDECGRYYSREQDEVRVKCMCGSPVKSGQFVENNE